MDQPALKGAIFKLSKRRWVFASGLMYLPSPASRTTNLLLMTLLAELQDELKDIATAVSRIHERLTNVIRSSEVEAGSLQERITELETDKEDMSRELAGIWKLNQALQERDGIKPETERVNATLRSKLHHVRTVLMKIRLLTEKEGLSPIYSVVSLEEAEAAMLSIESFGSLPEGSNNRRKKSSSEHTVRQQRIDAVTVLNTTTDVPINSRDFDGKPETSGRLQGRTLGCSGGGSKGSPKARESGSLASTNMTTRKGAASSSSSDQGPWRIHYSGPPLSTAIACGPMSWADLAKKLRLGDEKITSLQTLAKIEEHGLRIQIMDELAFVYDPIVLEGLSTSCLIDWGQKSRNLAAVKYVTKGNHVFHTFFFPVKKNAWYYFGAMTWTPVKQRSMWSTLGTKSKTKLAAKLKDRCGGRLRKKEIGLLVEEGESLEQICFEISGDSTKAASRSFASGTLGFEPPASSAIGS